MPGYGEFVVPPPLDDRPAAQQPTSVAEAPAGTVCSSCGHPNCPIPGACR